MPPLKLFICAAEPSGDHLAALLVRRLQVSQSVDARGLAGPQMRRSGVQPIGTFEGLTATGLAESIPVVPRAVRTLRTLQQEVRRWRPDVVVTVDAPSLLLRFSRAVQGIPRVHWVAPQVWAWNASRVANIAQCTDRLLCLFPFEPPWFETCPLAVRYTGHPDLALIRPAPTPPPSRRRVALCVGSRRANILRNVRPFARIAKRIQKMEPDASFVIPVAHGVRPEWLDGLPGERGPHIKGCHADVALTAPGTATLHWFAKEVPMVVAYRAHPLTWAIGRRLIGGTPTVSLPNHMQPSAHIPEHIQDLDAGTVAADVCSLFGSGGDAQRHAMRTARARLRGAGATSIAAAEVLRAARGQP